MARFECDRVNGVECAFKSRKQGTYRMMRGCVVFIIRLASFRSIITLKLRTGMYFMYIM
jgi:hypothetical protein